MVVLFNRKTRVKYVFLNVLNYEQIFSSKHEI